MSLADIYASKGENSLAMKDYSTALLNFAQSVRHAPRNADYHYQYAESLYANATRAQEASQALALQLRETDEAHRFLAEIALRLKDWDTAEIESQRATVLKPENSHYYYLFAQSLQPQKKLKQAMEAMDTAIRYAQPPKDHYYSTKAWLHWGLKDYNSAIDAWETACRLAPQNPAYPAQISRAYKMLNNFSLAEDYALAALELKPRDGALQKELDELRKHLSTTHLNPVE